ncbi:BTAD domain-containing putative transcriptional regulator [Nonomuraea sp. JJY05]|uniref:AfsR/SARP family transcriptional regulator n=1 Tax=Nonomuraea sp. JJY05 TaxID=3350255 RepID=UPI00373E20C0
MIVFRVLGALEVERDGRTLPIGAGKQRIALATLLLHANQHVSMDRLVDRLWHDDPPLDPRAAIHTHLTRLRSALNEGRGRSGPIETGGGGYLLRAAPESVDLLRFRQLVAGAAVADGEAKGLLLRQALGLWRGPMLSDVPSDVLHRDDVPSVLAERAHAQEEWFELAWRSGQGPQIIGELRAALTGFPLSERLGTRLMLCLYQGGRQAEALQVYETVRKGLRDEFGLEPGPEMRRVQALVLRQEPVEPVAALTSQESVKPVTDPTPRESVKPVTASMPQVRPEVAVPPGVGRLPADVRAFTGRAAQVEALTATLERAGVAAIAGTGGIGKSALAVHVAHRVAGRFPDGRLYVDLRGATPDVPPLGPREALGRILHAMGVPASAVPDDVEAAASLFRSMTGTSRLLLVLDNARDAGQVRPLLPGGKGCGVLVTSRRMLTSLDGVRHLQLDVLPEADAHALLGRLVGAPRLAAEPEASAEIVRRCGGLPLALSIVAARLAGRPDRPVAAMAARMRSAGPSPDGGLEDDDRTVRASFMVSYEDLLSSPVGEAAARVFRLLGLFDGHDIGVPAAAALADVPAEQAEGLLELLVDAQLVRTCAPGRYRMHDLLRLFARELSAQDRDAARPVRRMLHFYLATARRAVGVLSLPQLWRAEVGPAIPASSGLLLDTREETLAWADDEAYNAVAVVRQAARGEDDDLTVGLATALSYVLFTRGRWRQELQICRTALVAAIRSRNALYRAIIHQNLGTALSARERMAGAVPHLEQALRAYREVGVPRHEATLLDDLGSASCREGRYAESVDYHRQALKVHRSLGNRLGEGITLSNLGLAHQRMERYREAFHLHGKAIAIFRSSGNGRLHAAALGNLAEACRLSGRAERAIRHFEQALDIDRRAGHGGSYGHAERLWGLGRALHDLGKSYDARLCWDEAATILHDLDLISAGEKRHIQTSTTPETPEVIQRQL